MKRFKQAIKFASAVPLTLVVSASYAALPQAATEAIESLKTDGSAMVQAFWPVIVGVVVGLALMGIFKKGVSKAT